MADDISVIRPVKQGRKRAIKPKIERALQSGNIEDLFISFTPRQSAFVSEYIKDFDATAACRRAGYSGPNLNRIGHTMLRHPGIRAAIDHLQAEQAKAFDVDVGYVVRKLTKTLERCEDDENFNPNAVLRAAELLGKYLGMFIEKKEITGKDGGAIQYEKVQEDADAFTRAIAGLAERQRPSGTAEETQH
ncbi:terminase small subunit [Patescibacteria group bacterium]|nr:terminase small subunit [Patescibacteria group bacterium]